MPAYLLVTNPFSSRGLSDKRIALVERLFDRAGAKLDIHRTIGPRDARDAVAQAAGAYDVVVAAGGDGTIAEVASGLGGRDIPIGILPRGTANVLAGELGIPRSIEGAVGVILAGKTRSVDVGLSGDRRFLLMASAGFDAQLVAVTHQKRGSFFGKASYLLPAVKVLTRGAFPEIRVEAGGDVYSCRHVVVANVAGYGGPFHPAPAASCDDGLFDVVLYMRGGRYNMVRYGLAAFGGRESPLPDVIRLRTDAVALSSQREVPLQLDGDPAGVLPAEFRIARNDVSVIVP